MRRFARSLSLVLALACTSVADAQITRPDGSSRVVRSWDFEPVGGVLVPVPEHWFRAHDTRDAPRPGFPPWNEPALIDGGGVGGGWGVKIPTDGGSASLTLARGVVPVFADTDYAVIASVRTEDLRVSGAVVIARLIDGELNAIPGAEVRSGIIRSDASEWRSVHLQLRGHRDAQSIQLELQLLQPASVPGFRRARFEAVPQDLDGAAWIDNLTIYQTPRIDLRLEGRGNIVVEPKAPVLTMSVRDLAGETLSIETIVYDFTGRTVAVDKRNAARGGQDMEWIPEIDRFGWYRAVMEVRNEQGLIGRSYRDFVWLPKPDPRRAEFAEHPADRLGFGVSLPDRPAAHTVDIGDEHRYLLPDLLAELHTGAIAMPAWDDAGTPASREFALMIETMLEDGHDVSFILDELPETLAGAERVDRGNLLRVLGGESTGWVASIEQILSRFGERAQTWQVGAEGSSEPFFRDNIDEIVRKVRGTITGMVPSPRIRLPWRAEQPDDGAHGAEERSLFLPPSVRASAFELHAPVWADGNTSVLLGLPELDRFSPRDRVIELVKRVTLARANGARRIVIRAPWVDQAYAGRSGHAENGSGELMPTPEFAAMRLLSDALAKREIVGELKEINGARVFIAQGELSSMLIAWRDLADPEDAVLTGYLGDDDITVRDPFGNASASVAVDDEHRIPLREMPVYIEGIDVELAKFRAGLRIEPQFIQSEARRHFVELVMENPWDVPVSGRIRFKEPEEWKITPRVLSFRLGPNQTERYELSLALGGAEEAGPRRVLAEVELLALRDYPIFEVPMQVEVGLDSVSLRVSYRYENDEATGRPAHVIVTAVITNLSDQPVTLRSMVIAPDQPTQQRSISGLAPEQTVVRTFRFEGAVDDLAGETIRVGLREHNGPGRLNRSLTLPN